MIYVLYTIHVIVCLFLILVVLLQQGKGADLSVFGGGGTQAAFGPRGATTLLHKLTVWGFVAFTVMTISIGFLTGREQGSSVMQGVETEQAAPATQPSEPAADATGSRGADAGAEAAAPDSAAAGDEPEAASEGSRGAATESEAAPAQDASAESDPGTPDDATGGGAEAPAEDAPATEDTGAEGGEGEAAPASDDTAPPADEGEPESAAADPSR